ncbi:hypothetical protein [Nocardia sp. NPDC058666]|uniref:hypothetical protein n=1 Tax=Nocardia sp. NPDC058666 TaxID=3346587 RepID=UPI003657F6F9
MPKIGNGLDAVTAFAGAAAAGMSLFLPFTFGIGSTLESPYRVTSLVNSVPRAAALGLIVAVVVAVLIRPITRPGLVWLVATGAAAASGVNYALGLWMTSADVLSTQNYIDALTGGVLLGSLGICALRLWWAAIGFALGIVTVFVYGEVVAVFSSNTAATAQTAVHTPIWLIGGACVLLAANTLRHRHGFMPTPSPRLAADLPISPIVSITVLSLSLLLATEWLGLEFDGRRNNFGSIAVAVTVTVVAAFIAAVLLPGRDGAAVLVAVSLAAAGDALGDAEALGPHLVLVLAIGAAAILAGLRWATPWGALLGVGAVCVFAALADRLPWSIAWTSGVVLLTAATGFAAGSVRVTYLPSAVLGIGALYLPSVLWSIPTRHRQWPTSSTPVDEGTPGRVALAITISAAAALMLLYRIRPATPAPAGPDPTTPPDP